MLLKHSPTRKVPSPPGANNISHISADFPNCGLHIILEVAIEVAAGTAHFTGQAAAN